MKRLRRILFNTSAAISLLLCIVVVALWLRSYLYVESIDWDGHSVFISCNIWRRGQMSVIVISNMSLPTSLPVRGWTTEHHPYDDKWEHDLRDTRVMERSPTFWKFPGVRYCAAGYYYPWGGPCPFYHLIVRSWLLTLVTGILPGSWALGHLLSRPKKRVGFCRECGYDLRDAKPVPRMRDAKCSFAAPRLKCHRCGPPTACAVGYDLSPLRG